MEKAPCMCTEGGSCSGTHGLRHTHHKSTSPVDNGTHVSFDAEAKHCAKGAKTVAPNCSEACIEAQLKEGHKGLGDQSKEVKHSSTGRTELSHYSDVQATVNETAGRIGIPLP
jgi:hypothetical protein